MRKDVDDARPLALAAVLLGLAVLLLNAGGAVDVDMASLIGVLP